MKKIITFTKNYKGSIPIKKGDVLYDAREYENAPTDAKEPGIYMTQRGMWRVDIKKDKS